MTAPSKLALACPAGSVLIAPSQAALSPFCIDTKEVTNLRFGQFVNAKGYSTQSESKGWGWTVDASGQLERKQKLSWRRPHDPEQELDGLWSHPVVQVSLIDARAFCRWAGGRLPTETEWELAARGKLKAKLYPWGNRWPPRRVLGNFADESLEKRRSSLGAQSRPGATLLRYNDGYAFTAPVGSFEANGYGLHDMGGNVLEWVSSAYTGGTVARAVLVRGRPRSEAGIVRGGSWLYNTPNCTTRAIYAQEYGTSYIGFRCAYEAEPK